MRRQQLIRFDWAIKHILRDKANFDVLEGFLSELTGTDIKILEILESESNKNQEKDKINRVDIMVATQTGERVIVEVQCDRQVDYLSRILFGTCKAVVESIGEGEKYKNIKKVISVTVAYFDLGQGDDYVYHGTARFEGIHTHKLLTLSPREEELYHKKTVEDVYPEYYILRVNSFDHETRNNLDEWVYFLKNEKLPENYRARGLKEAAEKLDVLKLSGRERQEYERYLESLRDRASFYDSTYGDGHREGREEGREEGLAEGEKKGMKKGLAEGRKEGREEERELMAARMLQEGLDPATVAKISGLPLSRIERLSRRRS
ncbi:MAG: Rpn family recombination-promoting nuclease/putative transposase [Myxococcota bacterium]